MYKSVSLRPKISALDIHVCQHSAPSTRLRLYSIRGAAVAGERRARRSCKWSATPSHVREVTRVHTFRSLAWSFFQCSRRHGRANTELTPAPPAALPARVGSSATNSQISLQLSLTYTLNYTPTLYASQDTKLVKRHLVVHGMATLMIGQPATWTSPPLACCP